MFEDHFGLERTPFTREIPVEALFRSQMHREALSRLRYVAHRRMFMALTGESGVGKSTTLRALKSELDAARFEVFYLGMTNPSVVGFFENLLAALRVEIPYRPNRARRLAADILLDRFRSQQRIPVLLLDEADERKMLAAADAAGDADFVVKHAVGTVFGVVSDIYGKGYLLTAWRAVEDNLILIREFEAAVDRLRLDKVGLLSEPHAFVDREGTYKAPLVVGEKLAKEFCRRFPRRILVALREEEDSWHARVPSSGVNSRGWLLS